MLSLVDHPFMFVRFELQADAEPGLLPRLLVPFARRDLLPDQVRTRRCGDVLEASLEMWAMPTEAVHLVEGNLRQVVGVRRVSVTVRAAGETGRQGLGGDTRQAA